MMPVGLRHSAQIMGYVPIELKERIRRLHADDPWLTMSRQLNEAMAEYVPKKERERKLRSSRDRRVTSPKS